MYKYRVDPEHEAAGLIWISKQTPYYWSEDLSNDMFGYESRKELETDIALIYVMPALLKQGFEEWGSLESSWRWRWKDITSGSYPLEKLPAHVRDIAQALYY